MSSSRNKTRFSRPQVADYEKRRYRGLDQKIVDWKERRAVRRCLARLLERDGKATDGSAAFSGAGTAGIESVELRGAVVLDAPSGYGRMLDIVREATGPGGMILCADLSEAMVARALARIRPSGNPAGHREARDAGKADGRPDSGSAGDGGRGSAPRNSGRAEGGSMTPGPGRDGPRISGFAADIVAGIPLRYGAVDVVLSLRLFHHLHRAEDRAAALAEFARVARRGAVVSFYRGNRLHALQRKIRAQLKGTRYEVRMLAGRTFENEAAAAGFRIVKVAPLFRGIHAQSFAILEKR